MAQAKKSPRPRTTGLSRRRWGLALAGCLSAILLAAGSVEAAPLVGQAVVVNLRSGDILSGLLESVGPAGLTLQHAVLGTLEVPTGAVAAVTAQPEVEAPIAAAPELPAAGGEPPATAVPSADGPAYSGELSAGADGSSGNTERFATRLGLGMQRESTRNETKFAFAYRRADQETASGDGENGLTEDTAIATLRNDWRLAAESRWAIFVDTLFEYDKFRDFDYRLAGSVGPAYRFLDREELSLVGRAGLGASRKFGSEDDEVKPELLLGLDYKHQLTSTQKIVAGIGIYPDIADITEFRATSQVAYDISMVERLGLSLRLGIEDRYDSAASEGAKANDLDYYAALVRTF